MTEFESHYTCRYQFSGDKWKRVLISSSSSPDEALQNPSKRRKKDQAAIHHAVSIKCILPCHLRSDYIKRHELSAHDISSMMKHTDPRWLWMAGQLLGIGVNGSTIHASQSLHGVHVHCSEGAKIQSQLLKLFKEGKLVQDQPPSNNKCASAGGKFPFPLHLVDKAILGQFMDMLSKDVKRVMDWKDIKVLPSGGSCGYLKVHRVVPRSEFVSLFGPARNTLQLPFEHLTESGVWVETDEQFLLQTPEGHDALMDIESRDGVKGLENLGSKVLILSRGEQTKR